MLSNITINPNPCLQINAIKHRCKIKNLSNFVFVNLIFATSVHGFHSIVTCFISFQQDGGVSFKDAWMHLTDEYPIKYEAERLPPPVVADLNGDGKKEVLVATHDAKIQVR